MDPSDLPADIARLLGRLRDALVARGGLAGIYLYGSLATGDFSPARSDIDLVVMANDELDQTAVGELRELHATLSGSDPTGRLHCLSVPGRAGPRPIRSACTRTGTGTG